MKIKIGYGQLYTAFLNAWSNVKVLARESPNRRPAEIFEELYNIKFIDNLRSFDNDELVFPSQEDYFMFLLTHQ